ncbi:MAG: tyrosine-type recombinase/integrase [Pseudomonadota bacterium]
MKGVRQRLTKRLVESVVADNGPVKLWDSEVPGFHVEARPSGKRAFYLFYRVGGGRGSTQRRAKIGEFGPMTVDAAREKARQWAARVANGDDPAAERHQQRIAPRMNELFERYLEDHARPHKKPTSIAEDERIIRDYLAPAFGNRKVAELVRADVARLHAGLSQKPYRANRVLACLSKIMNLAEVWGLRPDGSNPCRHVKKYAERPRKRFLTTAELGRLGEALRAAERGEVRVTKGGGTSAGSSTISPFAIAAIRLLILTGMRSGEVKMLRWDWIDPERRRIHVSDSKTGEKQVTLNAAALEVLSGIQRVDGNPHVIVGGKPGAALVNLKDPWSAIRKAAGLEDVRIHDLRHSFAAVGAGSGTSLHIIGGLLGHSQAQTTKQYAHLADDPLRAASDHIGGQISSWLNDGSPER